MIKNNNTIFKTLDTKKYIVPSLPKTIDQRGYLYLVANKHYPELIKFGRTIDLHKRLQAYNSDQPEPNVSIMVISSLLSEANTAEEKILAYMKQFVSPVAYTKEWFNIDYKDTLINLIEKAEKEYKI